MAGCQFGNEFFDEENIAWKGFLEGVFWGLAAANSSDDGSHGFELCTSW
jgi:hypothetical protein